MEIQLFGMSLLCWQAFSLPHNSDGALNSMVIEPVLHARVMPNWDATGIVPSLYISNTFQLPRKKQAYV
jgi:hypothetical protein